MKKADIPLFFLDFYDWKQARRSKARPATDDAGSVVFN
jgi:hypothetical protein